MGYLDFTGKYTHSVDAKNRVNIPARFRKVLAEAEICEVVISKGIDSGHIDVFPLPKWLAIRDKISASMQLVNRTHRNFLRQITQNATHCVLDSQGRIMLTPALMELAGIKKGANVEFIGLLDFMEIWDPDELKKHEENTPLTESDFEKLEQLPLI
ncbi:MAG: division/cell wall cluster transcriptional repressor MraZ [Candidatus Neomarinimicrobiota bacterium]|nr:division/cell wall cluster transcriptional repressor MraZ [Candidatus Neomarinimicrobiota bacterium]MDD3965804.1 division/cell wall cluster transcriptional repressor MraZ [Candidatus Neomarinimicrobiota bacterium]MDX9779510.1 division/cell wall cluster transcriptional repressor MraZ [bacterium]